VEATDLIVTP